MRALELARLIRADFRRHGARLQEPGGWVLAAHRLQAHAQSKGPPHGVWRAATTGAIGGLAYACGLIARGIARTSIDPRARIGAAFHLIHAKNITIAPGVEIGERVGIMHEVTIGPGHPRCNPGAPHGVPKIGNDVFIGVGAAILGPITIGDGAMIAANSLVVSDVPAGAFAVGVPAKIVRWPPAAAAGATTPAGHAVNPSAPSTPSSPTPPAPPAPPAASASGA